MYAKLVFDKEIRLLKLDEQTFENLPTTLPKLFKTALPEQFSLHFLDESNDFITLSSFTDLDFLSKNSKNPVKLFIRKSENSLLAKKQHSFEEICEESKTNSQKPEKFEEKPTFLGVECDGCHTKPLIGVRYKCLNCENFDLCEKCEEKGQHSQHVFAKIKSPQQTIPCDFAAKAVNPEELFSMARPFIHGIKQVFLNKKQGNWGGHCNWSCGVDEKQKTKENKEDIEKKVREIAEKVKEIVGGSIEESIELVNGFRDNLNLEHILNVLLNNNN